MPHTIRRRAPLVLLTLALAVSSGATAGAAPGAGGGPDAVASKACKVGNDRGYGTTYVLSISARHVSCDRARSLVRAFHACRKGKRGRCPHVRGYSCGEHRFNKSRLSYDSRVRCARGSKVVRHTYTQFL